MDLARSVPQTYPIIRAFSADHVERLTGLARRALKYWEKSGFFVPEHVYGVPRGPYSVIYSFKDVVGLRALSLLRQHLSLQYLRKAAAELEHYASEPWSEMTLYVWGNEVLFREPDTEQMREVTSKQYIAFPVDVIASGIEEDAKRLTERSEYQIGEISRKRHVARNAWVVAGTRIPTKTVCRYKDAGYSDDDIIKEYPTLRREDVVAAIRHEAKLAA